MICRSLVLLGMLLALPAAWDVLGQTQDTARVAADSAARASSVSGVDTVVTYASRDSIVYDFSTRSMMLFERGDIRYRQMQLQAARIDVNWTDATMTSFGVADTSDTTGRRQRGTPIMKDGGEEYHGKELAYNFRTKKGRIKLADTQLDQGFYYGDRIKKVDQDVLFVADGRYTTCSVEDPHYYFSSPKMKVMVQDKVVAEPVYLYVADVPVFWLPLAVFPNKAGRRSGIIAPAIAEDATHGRMLRHIGYYWAMNDYMDLALRTDLYTKGSWGLSSDFRYALRYSFNGGLSGYYRKLIQGERGDPARSVEESYRVNVLHHQEIDPTTRMDANFTFATDNSYRNTIDMREALDQSITSNATLSKSWEGTPNSISLNISRRQNLVDGSTAEMLPSVSFNHSQSYPFRFGKKSSSSEGRTAWYEMIGVSYNAGLTNSRSKLQRSIGTIKVGTDTAATVNAYEFDRSQTLSQGIRMSIAPKLGYFTISPDLSYQDQRSFTDNTLPTRRASDSALVDSTVRQSSRSGLLSAGLSASTKIYGIVQPGLLGVAALRHTVTPSLSFTYSKYVLGENLPPKSMLMSLTVGNVFEMKTVPKEEGKEPGKIQLLNIGAGISYNFSADSLNFSPIGVSYRTGVGGVFDVGGSASFDLYKQDPVSFRRINTFLITGGGPLAKLTNFSVSLTTSLAGEKKQRPADRAEAQVADTSAGLGQGSQYYGLFREEEPDFSIPWKLGLSLDYSENKVQPFTSRSSSVRGNLEMNLTDNWKITMSGGYDILNREVEVPQIFISRDLHCWIMNFTWVPTGAYRHYQFEIRLKAPQLQDIKLTKQGSASGIY